MRLDFPRSVSSAVVQTPVAPTFAPRLPDLSQVLDSLPAAPNVARTSKARGTKLGRRDLLVLGVAAGDAVRGAPAHELVTLARELFGGLHLGQVKSILGPLLGRDGDFADARLALSLLAWAAANPEEPLAARVVLCLRDRRKPQRDGTGNDLAGIGDFQNEAARALRQYAPDLLKQLVESLPEFAVCLPALEMTTERLRQTLGQPLAHTNAVVIGHILAEAPAFMSALESLGLTPTRTRVRAIPYSSNELAVEALRQRGYDASNPSATDAAGKPLGLWGQLVDAHIAFRGKDVGRALEQAREQMVREVLTQAVDDHSKNGFPILVIDDGGYAYRVAKQHFADKLSAFRFVEHTTRGIRQIEAIGSVQARVVNVAESHVKQGILGPFVADAVVEAFLLGVQKHRAGRILGSTAAVLGYGAIGCAVARALTALGVSVTVYDPDPKVQAQAAADGHGTTSDRQALLSGRDFVLGCSGNTSLSEEDFAFLSPGTLLASTSSMNVEFRDSWKVAEQMGDVMRTVTDHLTVPPAPRVSAADIQIGVKVNMPGSHLHGTTIPPAQMRQHRIVRAFTDSLDRSLGRFGGSVRVNATLEMRTLDLGALIERFETPAMKIWQRKVGEAEVTLKPKLDSIWLANGGCPINFTRRLHTMPPERIQVTLQALVAGAVQAMTSTEAPRIEPLSAHYDAMVEKDFRARA